MNDLSVKNDYTNPLKNDKWAPRYLYHRKIEVYSASTAGNSLKP
jgi:hypothetical protein